MVDAERSFLKTLVLSFADWERTAAEMTLLDPDEQDRALDELGITWRQYRACEAHWLKTLLDAAVVETMKLHGRTMADIIALGRDPILQRWAARDRDKTGSSNEMSPLDNNSPAKAGRKERKIPQLETEPLSATPRVLQDLPFAEGTFEPPPPVPLGNGSKDALPTKALNLLDPDVTVPPNAVRAPALPFRGNPKQK